MRSIRLSLLVYFLVLLGLGLLAVSWLAYRNTQAALQDKEKAQQTLLKAQFDEDCKRARDHLDDVLLLQAQTLARQAQFQFQWGKMSKLALAPMTLMSSGLNANFLLVLPLWLTDAGRNSYFESLQRRFITEIQFHEDDLPRYGDGRVQEYFQIDSEEGNPWRSRSMKDRSFPFAVSVFRNTPLHEARFTDTELEPGLTVRRVTLKAPVARFLFVPGPRPRGPRRDRPPPRTEKPAENQAPRQEKPIEHDAAALFIQCAAETTERDEKLAALQAGLDEKLADLRTESADTLHDFWKRLLLIALFTFGATLAGGIWLFWLGLYPLQRLSDAVSRISVKDFRLPLDERRLPRELRPIAQRLAQTLELLQRAFAREKQAAADISHELRTPLAALLTTIEVGLRKTRSPEEYRELLTDCHAAGKQMNQLVERLLTLARLDAGADTLRPREVDVAALAEQCASLVRPLAEARGLSLSYKRNGPAALRTDPDKFREVLTNLLHNAIEYNQPNGRVEVSVARDNGHLELEVRDTGIGIAPEAREQIFQRFFRADPSRHADGLHAGLGLAIVKGYVDLMGGQIRVDSVLGKGSVFRLRFPAPLETFEAMK
jgi:heavy metal sensor kinase